MPFGIGAGPSSQEKQAYGGLNVLTGFQSSHGQNDVSDAENFWRSILKGGPEAYKVLAPQISAIKQRGQQQINTASQFGNRSGGTNAGNQMTEDNINSGVNSMIDSLTGEAGSALGQMGMGLTGQAGPNYGQLFKESAYMQQQEQAKWNDIFKSIGNVAGMVAGFPGIGGNVSQVLKGVQGGLSG
jgi:hypothetical protein